jgi:hypothetical protein
VGILYAGEKVVAIDDDDDSVITRGDVVGVVVTLLVNSPIAITVDDGIVDGALSPTNVVMVVVVPKLFELAVLLLLSLLLPLVGLLLLLLLVK